MESRGRPAATRSIGGYLIEGIAEFVEEDRRPVGSYYRLNDLRRYLRSGAWDGGIESANVDVPGLVTSAAYAIGYLTWRYLADRFGEERMFAFATAPIRNLDPPAQAGPAALGRSWPTLKRDCASNIRSAAR